MPNWCLNSLSVSGPVFVVQAFQKAAQGKVTVNEKGLDSLFSLRALVPCEHDYHAQIAAWGVKWDIDPSDTFIEHTDNFEVRHLSVNFETAWEPPRKFFETLAENWPKLKFEMISDEFDMGIACYMLAERGIVRVEQYTTEGCEIFNEETEESETYGPEWMQEHWDNWKGETPPEDD